MRKLIATGMFVAAALSSSAEEKKLTRAQLPAAVATTADREAQGATIKSFATEREHGKKVYEAETLLDGHTRDLQIAADGTLNEVEEEIEMRTLPAPVRDSILAKAKGATVVKVESLTKKGTLVAYEASTLRNGRKGEVQVGPAGGTLPHQE